MQINDYNTVYRGKGGQSDCALGDEGMWSMKICKTT